MEIAETEGKELGEVVSLGPDHVSAYHLAYDTNSNADYADGCTPNCLTSCEDPEHLPCVDRCRPGGAARWARSCSLIIWDRPNSRREKVLQ